jgi:hypothetical protein
VVNEASAKPSGKQTTGINNVRSSFPEGCLLFVEAYCFYAATAMYAIHSRAMLRQQRPCFASGGNALHSRAMLRQRRVSFASDGNALHSRAMLRQRRVSFTSDGNALHSGGYA